MRQKHRRVVIAGLALTVIALVFYVFMLSIAPKSNDPAAMMGTVGTVTGVMRSLGLVMIVVGLVGKKV